MKKTEYGLGTAIAMIIGIVIGSGIFFKSDNILQATGGSVALGVLAFGIAAIAIIFGSLTIAELASRTSKAGGIITYAEVYYNKSVACAFGWFQIFLYYPTLIGVVSWVSGIYICLLFGIAASLELQILIGLAIMILIFITNVLSAKAAGYFQNASTIIKLIPLALIAIAGFVYGDPNTISFADITQMDSVIWIAAIAPIAFSFDGWIAATSIGHEIKDSKKNLPKALIIAPIFILVVYLLYFIGINMYIGPETIMSLGDAHVDLVANKLLGPSGAKIVLIFVIISIMGTVNGLTLGLIRLPYSLAIRNMFPKADKISKVNEDTGMPMNSAIVSLIIVLVWYCIHYATVKFNLMPNGDVSEIAITISYVLYMLLYIKVFKLGRDGEILGLWKGKINPILASIGSLIILFGSITNPMFFIYAGICFMVLIAAVIYWKKYGSQNII